MKFIQAELVRTEGVVSPSESVVSEIHTVTWVPVDLKVKVGDILSDGKNNWAVDKVYPLIPEGREGGSPWRKKNA